MSKRPVPRYDFKDFGAAIKAARTGRRESRKKVCDEMFISPHYLANIEHKGQHPSLQIFFELMLRYNISVDQFLLNKPAGKDTRRLQLDALLAVNLTGIVLVIFYTLFFFPLLLTDSILCHSPSSDLPGNRHKRPAGRPITFPAFP